MSKPDISKLINKIKSGVKTEKVVSKIKSVEPKFPFNPPFKPQVKPGLRERDMRQEAMDMGAHGAKDYFGEKNARTI